MFGIINKVFSTYIVSHGTLNEWRIVFGTSAAIALLPVFFFTIWGSADRQPWATIHSSQTISPATIEEIGEILTLLPAYCNLSTLVKEKKISVAHTDSIEKPDDDSIENDDSVVSALRLRMFLENQESDEDSQDSTDDVETGKGQRF